MGFFERFRGGSKEEPEPFEHRILVPNFEQNEELEAIINEFEDSSTTMFGITHDYGIDMTTDINKAKIQESPDLKDAAERYFRANDRIKEIQQTYGDRLREYLKPYSELTQPDHIRLDSGEWNRWRMANTLSNIQKRKSESDSQ